MIAAEALVIFTPCTLPGDAGGTEKERPKKLLFIIYNLTGIQV